MIDLNLWLWGNTIMLATGGGALGRLAGALHFTSLHWAVEGFARGRVTHALGIQLARLALTGAVFVGLSRMGALALLGGTGGFLWARGVALRSRGVAP